MSPIAESIRKDVQRKIIGLSDKEFEDKGVAILRRMPEYQGVESSKTDPDKHQAEGGRPDAFLFLKETGKYIYFELTTTTSKDDRLEYVKDVCGRRYILHAKATIEKLVLVFSHTILPKEREKYREIIKCAIGCESEIIDDQNLTNMIEEYSIDLISSLFEIMCIPQGFKPIDQAVDDLHLCQTKFPSREELEQSPLIHNGLCLEILKSICNHSRATLLQGKWGYGKTVLALSVGLALQKSHGFTVYYTDSKITKSIDGTNEISDAETFGFSNTLFIIDDAHTALEFSYKFTKWAKKKGTNILLVSRTISEEMCEENQYLPYLFPESGAGFGYGDGELKIDDLPEPPADSGRRFFMEEDPAIVKYMIEVRTKVLTTDQIVEQTVNTFGSNLTLLALALDEWDPASGRPLWKTNFNLIYRRLSKRYHIEEFPEIFVLAALSFLDCSADLRALFPDKQRKSQFIERFLSRDSESWGILTRQGDFITGMPAADAILICRAGLHDRSFRDDDPQTIYDLLQPLLLNYARAKPENPFKLLRCIYFTAFELKISGDQFGEEQLRKILVTMLMDPQFGEYLKFVLLAAPRSYMFKLGNICRLYEQFRIPPRYSNLVICEDTIRNGVTKFRKKWPRWHWQNGPYCISWAEIHAWRHLRNINAELASDFLELLGYELILAHGEFSRNGLFHLLEVAANTEWIKAKVENDIDRVFGTDDVFASRMRIENEVNLIFFIRNVGAVGRRAINCLVKRLPPAKLAEVVRGCRNKTGKVIGEVYRNMPREYFDKFESSFTEEERYRWICGGRLDDIHSVMTDQMMRKFSTTDFLVKVKAADFEELQLFARNMVPILDAHPRQKPMIAAALLLDAVCHQVYEKIKNTPSIEKLGYFLRSLQYIEEDLAEKYIDLINDIDLSAAIDQASLYHISHYMFSLWLSGKPIDGIIMEKLKQKIIIVDRIHDATLRDKLASSGILTIMAVDVKLPPLEDSFEHIGLYLAGMLDSNIPSHDDKLTIDLAMNVIGLHSLMADIWTVNNEFIERSSYFEKIKSKKLSIQDQNTPASLRKRKLFDQAIHVLS